MRWYDPFLKALRSGAFVFAHFGVALLFVGTDYLIEQALIYFGDAKVFDQMPWRYVFQAISLVLVMVFGVFGTLEATRVFRGTDDEK